MAGRRCQGVAALIPQPSSTSDADDFVIVPPGRPLVAVMPFKPAVDDPSLRQLGTDIADALRERLERDPKLQAILISSDFLAQAPDHALELICRELRVGYLITGKCHPNNGTPSLYVEVCETRDWHIRWAEFYRSQARALLVPGAEVMAELAGSLRHLLVHHPAR